MADHRHNFQGAAAIVGAMCAFALLPPGAAAQNGATHDALREAGGRESEVRLGSVLAVRTERPTESDAAPSGDGHDAERHASELSSQTLLGRIPTEADEQRLRELDFSIDRDADRPAPLGPPLRPRRGGELEFLESDAGDLSLGFGLVRAGRASAREKDRRLDGFESAQMSVHGAGGPVQVFDAGLGWRFRPDRAVTLSFEGGLRTLTSAGPDADAGASLSDLGQPITLPVLGASLQWDPLSGLRLHGGATGHMNNRQGTFVDLFAEAQIGLTGSTDLVAGYRFLDASFESRSANARLSQDALYAGIRIRY